MQHNPPGRLDKLLSGASRKLFVRGVSNDERKERYRAPDKTRPEHQSPAR